MTTKTNPTLHLTPPKPLFRSRKAPFIPAPVWQHVPNEVCPSCGAEIETNGVLTQCMNRGQCDFVFSNLEGRRID